MSPIPVFTFVGPDKQNTVYIQNTQGTRTAMFTVNYSKRSKPRLSVNRVIPNGQHQPFFTSHTSSMSGKTRINIHNREMKMEVSYESVQLRREFDGPMGKLSWFPSGWGSDQKLKDKNGTVLAKFSTKIDSGSGKEPQLAIFVQCDDALVDLIVATGLTVYHDAMREKNQAEVVSELVGGLLGA